MLSPLDASKLRDKLQEVIALLDKALTDTGCLHEDKEELTTMGMNRRVFLCNKCNQELEEIFEGE